MSKRHKTQQESSACLRQLGVKEALGQIFLQPKDTWSSLRLRILQLLASNSSAEQGLNFTGCLGAWLHQTHWSNVKKNTKEQTSHMSLIVLLLRRIKPSNTSLHLFQDKLTATGLYLFTSLPKGKIVFGKKACGQRIGLAT